MVITHRFIKCKHCGKELEIFDDDFSTFGEKECYNCGYTNDLLYDFDIEIYYREF